MFYHYGILIDDGIVEPTSIQVGPSLFNDNRIIPPPGVISSIFKNGEMQFQSVRGPSYELPKILSGSIS